LRLPLGEPSSLWGMGNAREGEISNMVPVRANVTFRVVVDVVDESCCFVTFDSILLQRWNNRCNLSCKTKSHAKVTE